MEERKVSVGGRTYTETVGLRCAECGHALALGEDKYGVRYLPASPCARSRCAGSVGAHPDGRPLGRPADRRTKDARIVAHEEFDRLWKGGLMGRSQAYAWMVRALGISAREAHIGEFGAEECRRLGEALRRDFPDLFLSPDGP